MAELHKKFPDERERSLFASVELSLRRLSPEMREKIKPLGVFQGGGHIATIAFTLELSEKEIDTLVQELIGIGLAIPMPYGFIRFHPALCPYLWQELDQTAHNKIKARWAESMKQLSAFIYQEGFKKGRHTYSG